MSITLQLQRLFARLQLADENDIKTKVTPRNCSVSYGIKYATKLILPNTGFDKEFWMGGRGCIYTTRCSGQYKEYSVAELLFVHRAIFDVIL